MYTNVSIKNDKAVVLSRITSLPLKIQIYECTESFSATAFIHRRYVTGWLGLTLCSMFQSVIRNFTKNLEMWRLDWRNN